jgi:hypothetical protein
MEGHIGAEFRGHPFTLEAEVRNLLNQFIKYFTTFFLIVITIVLFGQLKDQGKPDIYFSLTFSATIAALGAFLSTAFACFFRRLDATLPWVQPSEYSKLNEHDLNTYLNKIRRIRFILYLMLFAWLPYGILIISINLSRYLILIYILTLIIVSLCLYLSICPRCKYYFFYYCKPGQIGDSWNDTLNLFFGFGYRNIFSSRCLNCGLKLKK